MSFADQRDQVPAGANQRWDRAVADADLPNGHGGDNLECVGADRWRGRAGVEAKQWRGRDREDMECVRGNQRRGREGEVVEAVNRGDSQMHHDAFDFLDQPDGDAVARIDRRQCFKRNSKPHASADAADVQSIRERIAELTTELAKVTSCRRATNDMQRVAWKSCNSQPAGRLSTVGLNDQTSNHEICRRELRDARNSDGAVGHAESATTNGDNHE